MNRVAALTVVFALIVALGGCTMSETGQRTASGSLMGAAVGGIIGAIAGNAGMGAAIGAGLGATGGFLYGKHKESEQEAYERGRAAASRSR
jgi:uncharacterized protein YcfJ